MPAPTQDDSARQAIVGVVNTFARGESAQDVSVLETVLHPSFVMTALLKQRVVSFDRGTFLDGIAAKKFGGNHNPLTVDSVDVDGSTTMPPSLLPTARG